MIPYKENNIDFRIASADSIGKFKINQAHSFIQVNRKEFDFGLAAREVLLLSYDRLSSWLMKIERMFLDEEQRYPSAKLIEDIHFELTQSFNGIEETCLDNPIIFDKDITALLRMMHCYATEDLRQIFKERMQSIPMARAFQNVANAATDYLQHLLLAMHEYNNNIVLRKSPFLCIGGYSLLPKDPCFNSILKRAEFFRHHLDSNTVFLIKNYTSEDLSHQVIMTLWTLGVSAMPEIIEATV